MASTVVDVVGLAAARLPELKRLLDDSSDGLPVRHLRRRATAHDRRHRGRPKLNKPSTTNSTQPPHTLTNAAATQAQDTAGRLSRKQRRRPAVLYALHDPHADDEEAPQGEAKKVQATNSCTAVADGTKKGQSHPNVSKVRWLETHLWFAKRCRMVQRDGWALPEHRSDRGCSAAVDASRHGCVAFDATATQPLEVRGYNLGQLASLLARLGDPSSLLALAGGLGSDLNSGSSSGQSKAKDKGGEENETKSFSQLLAVLRGQHEGNAWIHALSYGAFPRGLIGPARLLLDPALDDSHDHDVRTSPAAPTGPDQKPEAAAQCAALLQSPAPRRLWLWCHPAMRADAIAALNAVLHEVDNGSGRNDRAEALSVGAPSDGGVVRFQLRGPNSAATLARIGVAVPHRAGGAGNTSTRAPLVSEGDLWASTVGDPRRLRFPPGGVSAAATATTHGAYTTKVVKSEDAGVDLGKEQNAGSSQGGDARAVDALQQFWNDRATATKAAADLPDHVLNEQTRQAAAAAAAASVNAGKWHSSTRGKSSSSYNHEKSTAIQSEVIVPVVAVARPILNQWRNHQHHHQHAAKKSTAAVVVPGWDLIVPAGWGRAFWVALAMAGAHAGGEDERHAVLSASGQPHFPADFPDSLAGAKYWQPSESSSSTDGNAGAGTSRSPAPAWQPKPKSKGRALPPHACNSALDWLALFSSPSTDASTRALGVTPTASGAAVVSATATAASAMTTATTTAAKVLVARENRYVVPLFQAPMPAVPRPIHLTVTLVMTSSGVPHAGSTIHLLKPSPRATSSAVDGSEDDAMSIEDEIESAPVDKKGSLYSYAPDRENAKGAVAVGAPIGRVTSGAYAKHLGKGCGVGLCTVSGLQRGALEQLSGSLSPPRHGGEASLEDVSFFSLLRAGALCVAVIAPPSAKTPRCRNTAAVGAKSKTASKPNQDSLKKVHEATLSIWIEGS